jgi:hypothetical protein
MKIKRLAIQTVAMLSIMGAFYGCKVTYSLSGAVIPAAATTVSIAYFPNNAPLVAPTLSSTLTEALQDKFSRQTKLDIVRENGDLAFEGEITGYTTVPTAISGSEYATENRLTITVRVSFTNIYEPQYSFPARTFSAFLNYPSSQMLQEAEGTLIPEIVEMLVDDIFNAAVSNW